MALAVPPGVTGAQCVSGTGQCQPALSYAQLEGYWIKAGGPSSVAPIMAAVALAESAGIPNNVQAAGPLNPGYGTTGWGLWQITPGNSYPNIGSDAALLDPLTNARVAVAKYNASLAATGNGLLPWTTATSGAYKAFYQSGVTPVLPSGSGSGSGSTPIIGGLGNLASGAGGVLSSAGNAVGGVLNTEQNVVNTLLNPQDLIGSGIASGLRAVGASILPWVLIIGLMIFSLVLVGHELLRKSNVAVVPV